MSIASEVVGKYAKAALDIAAKNNITDKFLSDLQLFCDNISVSFLHELSNPTIAKKDLVRVVDEISGKLQLNEKTKQFLSIIAEARRIKLLYQIRDQFAALVKQSKKILTVKLLVSESLETAQIQQIRRMLERKYPGNVLEIKQVIDPDILGGLVIKIDSFVIDASLKNQLSRIAEELKSAVL